MECVRHRGETNILEVVHVYWFLFEVYFLRSNKINCVSGKDGEVKVKEWLFDAIYYKWDVLPLFVKSRKAPVFLWSFTYY